MQVGVVFAAERYGVLVAGFPGHRSWLGVCQMVGIGMPTTDKARFTPDETEVPQVANPFRIRTERRHRRGS